MLHYYGLNNTSLGLIESYLKNRQQRVKIKSDVSRYLTLKSGVPQGSVLSALLYTVYTSTLSRYISKCKIHFYADDTQIYYSFYPNDTEQACQEVNRDIDELINAFGKFCLEINPHKTKLMLFGQKNTRQKYKGNINIQVKGHKLETVKVCRNLGLELDDDLTFEQHVSKVIKRAFSQLKSIYSVKEILNYENRIILCESLVLSQFNYADVVYGPCLTKANRKRLQRIQNSCIRLVFGLRKYDHISHKYEAIKWLNIHQRQILHCCCLFHLIIKTQCPKYLYHKITYRTDVHHLGLRHRDLIEQPIHRTMKFRGCYKYLIYKYHNRIPNEMKQYNPKHFKIEMKNILLNSRIDFS